MAPKRAASDFSEDDDSDRPKKKAAPKKKKAATPKLKKSKGIDSYSKEFPDWTNEKPTGPHAKAAIERWCLLAPYDPAYSEDQWKEYYDERAALDKIQTVGSEESKVIVSEELGQDTFEILGRTCAELAALIMGSAVDDEERKEAVARTLQGSLYMLKVWGNDEGDGSPRTVDATTRLYSPYGIGTSIDFKYDFHYRAFRENEKFALFIAAPRSHCDSKKPTHCIAAQKGKGMFPVPTEHGVQLFTMKNGTSKGLAQGKMAIFEETLFGTQGWLSPKKLWEVLATGGTAQAYNEGIDSGRKMVSLKFKSYFQGEAEAEADELPVLVDGNCANEIFLAEAKALWNSGKGEGEAGPAGEEAPVDLPANEEVVPEAMTVDPEQAATEGEVATEEPKE